MTDHRRVVLKPRTAGDRLPEWASGGVVILEWLRQQGRWEEAADLLRVQREGGYAGLDALLFLIYYFASGLRVGVKEFSDRAREQHQRLAAVGGRRRLPTQSSMSRLLTAVEPNTARIFGNWLLRRGPGISSVLNHPSVLTRDATGAGWHVFDWDPTVTTLRHRALPELDGTPEARRRSQSLAAPGYPGRKRGDTQFSRATLQHAGSGLWLGIEMAPGNGTLREQFQGAIEQVQATCDLAGLERGRLVLRADGAAGNVPFITACAESCVHYITRLAHYQLLQDPEVVAHLADAVWYDVPSSESGPRRQACDLGRVQLDPAAATVRSDGRSYDPIAVRVVVSRFPSRTDKGRGAGVVIDGWQYELYATDLDPCGWPEAELVAGYYGRTGQENRFHQEDRELGLDRIFSYHLPGQQLATLIGLFVWNFQICRGMELSAPPKGLPEQPPSPITPAVQPVVLPLAQQVEAELADIPGPASSTVNPPRSGPPEPTDGEPTASEIVRDFVDAIAAQPDEPTPARRLSASTCPGAPRDINEAMDAVDWGAMLERHPGWHWSAPDGGLHCPGKTVLPLIRIEHLKDGRTRARFVAPGGACDSCGLRDGCVRSHDPGYRKDIRLSLPEPHATSLRHIWLSLPLTQRRSLSQRQAATAPPSSHHRRVWRLKQLAWAAPEPPVSRGSFAVMPPLLLPAELRKHTRRITNTATVYVRVNGGALVRRHPVLVQSSAERQRRRLSWCQRLAWNGLFRGTAVEISLLGDHELSQLLHCTQTDPKHANIA